VTTKRPGYKSVEKKAQERRKAEVRFTKEPVKTTYLDMPAKPTPVRYGEHSPEELEKMEQILNVMRRTLDIRQKP
jgi:hypothetical protein